jgi:hypothetical protein
MTWLSLQIGMRIEVYHGHTDNFTHQAIFRTYPEQAMPVNLLFLSHSYAVGSRA